MVYKVIGLMSGSSLDGLDIAYVHLQEIGGSWTYEIKNAECLEYNVEWKLKLREAVNFSALEYQLLHISYGHYIGKQVNHFTDKNNLHHRVDLVVSHGHTTFHCPDKLLTAQLGDGAAIAAETTLPVVTDLRAIDVAFGGQGAPVVPIGELLLLSGYDLYLNIGGIANISARKNNTLTDIIAFDVCAANRVLNMLAEEKGLPFDDEGRLSASGNVNDQLLQKLNDLDYYRQPYPKSLANNFGTHIVYPILKSYSISVEDSLRTYAEHIIIQVKNAIINCRLQPAHLKLLVTGGGAFNSFLISKLKEELATLNITVTVPDADIINYKEAVIMALMGTLRWREEYNVLSSVTGAKQNSIGGALWLGTEA